MSVNRTVLHCTVQYCQRLGTAMGTVLSTAVYSSKQVDVDIASQSVIEKGGNDREITQKGDTQKEERH